MVLNSLASFELARYVGLSGPPTVEGAAHVAFTPPAAGVTAKVCAVVGGMAGTAPTLAALLGDHPAALDALTVALYTVEVFKPVRLHMLVAVEHDVTAAEGAMVDVLALAVPVQVPPTLLNDPSKYGHMVGAASTCAPSM